MSTAASDTTMSYIRKHYFATPLNSAISVLLALFTLWVLWPRKDFATPC